MLTLDKNEGKILFIRTIANETVAIDLSKVRRITLNELGRRLSPTFKSGKSLIQGFSKSGKSLGISISGNGKENPYMVFPVFFPKVENP